MIEAVIFDMDGLLVDSEPVWDRARRGMAEEVGKDWNEADHQAVMGVSTQAWAAYMINRLELSLSPQEVQDQIIVRMLALYQTGIPYFPGAVEAVKLAAQHYPTALASGSHRALIDAVAADAALRGQFRIILSADEVGAGKPAPDVYLETAKRLGVKPERCVCLEDSGNGILAGHRAGMRVIAVPDPRFPPASDKLDLADLILPSLSGFSLELIHHLEDRYPPL
ncbi:MAG: HAD family phosphatase [Anaerolineae bacterium]|nr:HAD family phosphatase [Anaerolineae bacterium]